MSVLPVLSPFLVCASIISLSMVCVYALSLVRDDNSLVDIAYGLIFVLLAWGMMLVYSGSLSITILITLWGGRLAWRIYRRNAGKGEDFRYAQWRNEWMGRGRIYFLLRSVFQIYVLQGIIIGIIASPLMYMAMYTPEKSVTVWIGGVLVSLFGLLFEAIADHQLDVFKKHAPKRGSVLQSGLWKYSRHPNYFGEVVFWWGIWLLSTAYLPLHIAIVAAVSPLLITVLILFVSGIPLLEKKYSDNAEFQEYARRTSIFFPLPPRN